MTIVKVLSIDWCLQSIIRCVSCWNMFKKINQRIIKRVSCRNIFRRIYQYADSLAKRSVGRKKLSVEWRWNWNPFPCWRWFHSVIGKKYSGMAAFFLFVILDFSLLGLLLLYEFSSFSLSEIFWYVHQGT